MTETAPDKSPEESPEAAPEEPKLWQYGSLYWGVAMMPDEPIQKAYLEANGIKVTPNGDLVFIGEKGPLFIIAAGRWHSAWAAAIPDGTPVAIHKTEKV